MGLAEVRFSLLGHLGVILGVVLTPNTTKLTAVANELTGYETGPSPSDYLLFNYRWLSDLGQWKEEALEHYGAGAMTED